MPDVDLVDFGGGNIGSVQRCLERLAVDHQLVDSTKPPTGDRPLILPGVGAFGAVCEALSQGGLDHRLKEIIATGTPFLGICVGLQVLLDGSEESPGVPGLGIIPGRAVRLQAAKVPQIGWNLTQTQDQDWPDGFVYFVNSYVAQPQDPAHLWYESDYEGSICAGLRKDNVSAFQFHPEKSGALGQSLLGQWCREAL